MLSESTSWPNLPPRVKSRFLPVNGLRMHFLEAIPETPRADEPLGLIILLHGFPELAYSWRKVIGPLADAGYHVVAPDQRVCGRTTPAGISAQTKFDDSLLPFQMTNMVKDVVGLVHSLGYNSVVAVVGHDFGSPIAAYCALIRPDLFRSVVMMSAPFTGPPQIKPVPLPKDDLQLDPTMQMLSDALGKLDPPRTHYTHYYSTRQAGSDMLNPPNGLHAFMREYYHVKSASWEGNHDPKPHPTAVTGPADIVATMAALPHYYVMGEPTMPLAVNGCGPSGDDSWLTDEELAVYVQEYARTGFQGNLNWYRIKVLSGWEADCELFSGKRIEIPAMFIAGSYDWGTYQVTGAAEMMKEKVCAKMEDQDFVLIEGAGHWVQQEKSVQVVNELLRFLQKTRK
ncbi:Epoxide hydrolase hydrolase [Mycena indigotica]|uniref:Epoxide hydrolase hydrolase n=1 Tax=Mycena indigotica TaxID=2126181 RepID=A0A8H6TG60_9AGAR|nr:Epoxide hydrolase hydrolase [Mycena indigotica]KAF7316122.1 Epoxide hydrolase hydrolase [Mycena indigotica]